MLDLDFGASVVGRSAGIARFITELSSHPVGVHPQAGQTLTGTAAFPARGGWLRRDDDALAVGVFPGRFDVSERDGARRYLKGPAGDFGGQLGELGQDVGAGTEPCPLPTICRGTARSAAEGTAAVGPATEPISTQVRGCPWSVRFTTTAAIASAVAWPQR